MQRHPVVGSLQMAGEAAKRCPAPEALAAWIDWGLGAAERARLDAHLAGCDECRLLVAQVIDIQAAAGDDAPVAAPVARVRRVLPFIMG